MGTFIDDCIANKRNDWIKIVELNMDKNQTYFLPYPLPLNKIRENAQSGTESDKKKLSAGAFQLEWDRHRRRKSAVLIPFHYTDCVKQRDNLAPTTGGSEPVDRSSCIREDTVPHKISAHIVVTSPFGARTC